MRRVAELHEALGRTRKQLDELDLIPPIAGGAMELYRWTFPAIAASAIRAGDAVGFPVGSGGLDRQVVPLASWNLEPFGVALATANYAAATPPFTAGVGIVDRGNTIKVAAGASLGAGADVGVATVSGSLIYGPVVGAAGTVVWRVGKAVSPAAAGEVFSLYVDPRQLSGMP